MSYFVSIRSLELSLTKYPKRPVLGVMAKLEIRTSPFSYSRVEVSNHFMQVDIPFGDGLPFLTAWNGIVTLRRAPIIRKIAMSALTTHGQLAAARDLDNA